MMTIDNCSDGDVGSNGGKIRSSSIQTNFLRLFRRTSCEQNVRTMDTYMSMKIKLNLFHILMLSDIFKCM